MKTINHFALFRQLLHASPKAPTFGALPPAWHRPVSRPLPGLTFSMQSCGFAVSSFLYEWTLFNGYRLYQ
jgi:hypothetical protein